MKCHESVGGNDGQEVAGEGHHNSLACTVDEVTANTAATMKGKERYGNRANCGDVCTVFR